MSGPFGSTIATRSSRADANGVEAPPTVAGQRPQRRHSVRSTLSGRRDGRQRRPRPASQQFAHVSMVGVMLNS